MIRCTRCGESKPPAEMVPHPLMPHGVLTKCLRCAEAARAALALPARPQAPARRRKLRRPAVFRAWAQMQAALDAGAIRKRPCERCGDPAVHSHHDDLARPTEVRWLCRVHRDEVRREMYLAAGGVGA